MNPRIASFAPAALPSAKILILGSIPGVASLNANQYYAHPRNAFWKIMGELIGFDVRTPYPERIDALKNADIALWDVLHSCQRKGSLDTAIEADSITANDLDAFLDIHSSIKLLCFNGATAERCFRQHVKLKAEHAAIAQIRLPSTSPAHAALSFGQKLSAWRSALWQKR
jgi:hypoxanthine-DNA glycosylase